MAPRLELHALLKSIPGVKDAYFQPPGTEKMQYPCILYPLDDVLTKFADNRPYSHTTRYQVTVIDRNPESKIRDHIAALPMCTFSRFYTADGLNHFVYNLYF